MAIREGTNIGYFDGDQDVTIVPAPPPGFIRHITFVRILNVDDAAVTPNVRIKDSSPEALNTETEEVTIIDSVSIGTDERMEFEAQFASLKSTQSFVARIGSAVSTNEPNFYAEWFDRTII